MLILTRKPGETVVIGDDVRITVLAVRGSQIKLGIEAPREVRVNREEVLEREAAGGPQVASRTDHSPVRLHDERLAPGRHAQPARDDGRRGPPHLDGTSRGQRASESRDRRYGRQGDARTARRRIDRRRDSEAA